MTAGVEQFTAEKIEKNLRISDSPYEKALGILGRMEQSLKARFPDATNQSYDGIVEVAELQNPIEAKALELIARTRKECTTLNQATIVDELCQAAIERVGIGEGANIKLQALAQELAGTYDSTSKILAAPLPWRNECTAQDNSSIARAKAREAACGHFQKQVDQIDVEAAPNKKVARAINALTSVRVEVGIHSQTGEPYYSGDFRDHPEFDQHFTVLTETWGVLPENDSKRRTLELMRTLVEHRRHAEGLSDNDINNVYEVVWRQVDGVDIFMAGFQHSD